MFSSNWVKFLISFISLIFVFFVTRFPFFYYFKIPQVVPDFTDYILIARMLKGVSSIQEIGFPGVGYPFFLNLSFVIKNKLLSIVYIQTLLQFISISFFLIVYNRFYNRFFYWVLFIMLGYLGASFNQLYDTTLTPDSLLSSIFIFFTSGYILLFNSNSKYINYWFLLISSVLVYSISVRANGILLLPLLVIYLIWFYFYYRDLKRFFTKIILLIIPFLSLSLFNFFSPIYKVFSPIGVRKVMYEDTTGVHFEKSTDSTWFYLTSIVPEGYFYKDYKKGVFNDVSSYLYINSYSRGYRIKVNSLDSIIIRSASDEKWGFNEFNLNKYVDTSNVDKFKKLENFKKYLTSNNLDAISVDFSSDLNVKFLLFISFFKYYYVKDIKNNFTKENDFFYGDNIKNYYWRLNSMNELMRPFNDMSKDVFKEFHKTKFLNDIQFIDETKTKVFWEFKSSRFYRYIVKPYYFLNDLLIRNFLFPILFLVVYFLSIINILRQKMIKLNLILFGIGSILMLTNVLHSFVLGFLLSRYTYQVSFIYYIFVAFVPLFIFQYKMQRNAK